MCLWAHSKDRIQTRNIKPPPRGNVSRRSTTVTSLLSFLQAPVSHIPASPVVPIPVPYIPPDLGNTAPRGRGNCLEWSPGSMTSHATTQSPRKHAWMLRTDAAPYPPADSSPLNPRSPNVAWASWPSTLETGHIERPSCSWLIGPPGAACWPEGSSRPIPMLMSMLFHTTNDKITVDHSLV